MGWAGGSELAAAVWAEVRPYLDEIAGTREYVAQRLVELFEGEDCDTMNEARQLMRDAFGEHHCQDCRRCLSDQPERAYCYACSGE